MKKTAKFFTGSLLLALVLVASVPLCDWMLSFVFSNPGPAPGDTTQQLLAGIGSEALRAFITYYLYSVTENKGSNPVNNIKLKAKALSFARALIFGIFTT